MFKSSIGRSERVRVTIGLAIILALNAVVLALSFHQAAIVKSLCDSVEQNVQNGYRTLKAYSKARALHEKRQGFDVELQ